MRRFQIGFVWRLFRFLVLLSGNVRIRLCHRLAAVACCAATQAHLVLVIRPASAIRHLASAIRHPPLASLEALAEPTAQRRDRETLAERSTIGIH